MTVSLVIPTCRPLHTKKFLSEWDLSQFDEVIVVEDSPEVHWNLGTKHYSHKEIDEKFGDNSWIFGERNSSIRSFGFLMATSDYICTLDDDCLPHDKDFAKTHINNIENTPVFVDSVPDIKTRGTPYFNHGRLKNVVLSVGGVCGCPDLDAPHNLVNPITDFISPNIINVLHPNQVSAICGMNLCFTRKALPLMYFQSVLKRADDIIFGYIAQLICRKLGWHISMGTPRVWHSRASDPIKNLADESKFIGLNETLWELIYNINLKSNTAEECMLEVADVLLLSNDLFIQDIGEAIEIWIGLLESVH